MTIKWMNRSIAGAAVMGRFVDRGTRPGRTSSTWSNIIDIDSLAKLKALLIVEVDDAIELAIPRSTELPLMFDTKGSGAGVLLRDSGSMDR